LWTERSSPCKLLVHACSGTGASGSNPAGGNRGSKPASRSASEPDSASLHFWRRPVCRSWWSLSPAGKQRASAPVGPSGV